jgi:hypothetical protein
MAPVIYGKKGGKRIQYSSNPITHYGKPATSQQVNTPEKPGGSPSGTSSMITRSKKRCLNDVGQSVDIDPRAGNRPNEAPASHLHASADDLDDTTHTDPISFPGGDLTNLDPISFPGGGDLAFDTGRLGTYFPREIPDSQSEGEELSDLEMPLAGIPGSIITDGEILALENPYTRIHQTAKDLTVMTGN